MRTVSWEITNGIIQRTTLANLQLGMRRLLDAQHQATTGKRIRAASDDPIGVSKIMHAAGSLRALDQYRRNIASAPARLNASAVQLGNRQHEGEFLFGGDQSRTAPFQSTTPSSSTTPPTGADARRSPRRSS